VRKIAPLGVRIALCDTGFFFATSQRARSHRRARREGERPDTTDALRDRPPMMPIRGSAPMSSARGSFVPSPRRTTIRAFVTASGQFNYRSANIGIGYNHAAFGHPRGPARTYHIQGWTVVAGRQTALPSPTMDTGHGMTVGQRSKASSRTDS